ncbi:MAG: methyltransferase domain-containing protein [Phycisphaerales bacterium]|nr:methyltransferase domain-containing protein [Phycisphaerales bacterium]
MMSATPAKFSSEKPIRLHLGGHDVKEGWTLLNAQPRPGVDVVGLVTDLSMFADGSVSEVYASHVYEHLGMRQELHTALKEVARVLKTGGILRVAVPDLEILMKIFADPQLPVEQHQYVQMMICGGQVDEYDFHKCGFTFDLLASCLQSHGFCNIKRVQSFDLFDDTSMKMFGGVCISLNMQCTKS